MDPFAQGLWDSSSAAPPAAAAAELPGMQVDWKETGEVHVIKADLPGVRREEVKVELESGGRVLQISGERRREVHETGDTWRQVERSSGRFMRRLSLPENAKVEGVKASMEHGVLTVVVPKAEVNQLRIESAQMSG
ncbi:class I heat shock protein-like [Musa acuminata AAA Group]|uniref:class I heat shock protein-like n=1 Tax=Musa acuminata AAA Group TaxID=214697 RepID=UPI0031CEBF81